MAHEIEKRKEFDSLVEEIAGVLDLDEYKDATPLTMLRYAQPSDQTSLLISQYGRSAVRGDLKSS